jgi:FdhE protein
LVISGATVNWARTASGFVLAPYLQLACDLILPRIPLNLWYREYCPICGGRPAFAALTSGSGPRTLLCPRCYGEWSYGRIGCPFCKSTDSQTYYSGDEGRYRLYVCGVCNRYIKTVDVRERNMDLCLPVECLVTVSMDIAAQEKGFKFY